MEWRPRSVISCVSTCMMFEQHPRCRKLPFRCCEMKRASLVLVLCFNVGAVLQQELYDVGIPIERCLMKWCPAIDVSRVDICTLINNRPSNVKKTVGCCHMQWCLTVRVPNIHVFAVRK